MPHADPAQSKPGLLLGRGVWATERLLLERVAALCDEAREDPALLACPVRIVVPSRSLREHVAARLVAERGASLAGVVVQTLHGLALEVLERVGESAPRGDAALGVLVRRLARDEPDLHRVLHSLEDGYGVVVGAVTDLLDAGFEAVHAGPLEDALEEEGWRERRMRAGAVVRTAARVLEEMERLEIQPRGAALRRARECLESDPACLPQRSVLVHGFADATGLAGDLLLELARRTALTFFLDEPPDLSDPSRADVGAAFSQRLREQMEGVLGPGQVAPAPPLPLTLAGIEANGAFAEARAVAERIRRLLDAGQVEPERIGVVARDIQSYTVPLRLHFGRLGIPFSGLAASAPPDAAERRVHALLVLLADTEGCPTDRWVDVLGAPERSQLADLRLGLHAVGAARLRDVADLVVDDHLDGNALALPVRRGLVAAPEDDPDGGPRLTRRRLGGDTLRGAVEVASRLRDRLASWPERAPFGGHRERLLTLAADDLAWRREGPEFQALERALEALAAELPDSLGLSLEDVVLVSRRSLEAAVSARAGGRGGGVAVLGVVEARARSFEHLFVVGMNRDVFPRVIVDDPVLPDDVRRRIQTLLPSIPVKARGVDEERYLFAQLVSASPTVGLVWQAADDDGKARSPSPLLAALELAEKDVALAPSLYAPPGPAAPDVRTVSEALLAEGLHGNRERFSGLLPAALLDSGAATSEAEAEVLARGRMAVLAELDPDRARSRELGPYFGFVGPVQQALDPRGRDLFVTQLERFATCPWRHLLEKLLGLEPPPDALERLPSLTPLLVGNLVHRVLEDLARDAGCERGTLEEAETRTPRGIPWPGPEELELRLLDTARGLLREEGIGPPALARLLAETARPHLQRARELAWPDPDAEVGCLGVEVTGRVPTGSASSRSIWFKADRVDRVGDALRLIDYKTGKAITGKDLRQALLKRVVTGKSLQVPAYAFGSGGEGRFLFLQDEGTVVTLEAEDAEARQLFEDTVEVLLAARAAGALFPRLARSDEPAQTRDCAEYCDVREACLQGDAGARRRLFEWVAREDGEPSDAEAALRALWELPDRKLP